jgi:hypothetical protein
MNDPNRRDVLGTSVADYRRRFNEGLGEAPTTRGITPEAPAPAPAPDGTAPPPPQTGGGMLTELFGGQTTQQPAGQQPAVGGNSNLAANAARQAEALTAQDDPTGLRAVQVPQLDLTRLRALMQRRGMLGTA